jgi:rhamnulokinase
MPQRCFLAVDLGAESGRVLAGLFDGERIVLEPLHRFPNGPVEVAGTLHWDVLRLWQEIQSGLRAAAKRFGNDIASVGVDTWGVDFALLGAGDVLLGNPVHYRDARTDGMLEAAFAMVGRDAIFEQTGIQFMQLNSLYQLLALRKADSPLLGAAETFLTMPDLFGWLLGGRKAAEFTNATTTQCYDTRRGDWARPLLEQLGIPTAMFPEIIPPGTPLGTLRPAVARETGLHDVQVVAPATHDTGSAVAAVPVSNAEISNLKSEISNLRSQTPNWCYLSSGTWSLMGVEIPEPKIDAATLAYNFTNEGGVAGTYRLLKNIMGLWLVQRCRRAWQSAGREYSYDDLQHLAASAAPFGSLVNPDDGDFLNPPDMPAAIAAFCRRTNQPVPADEGAVVRCCVESLALRYRWVVERLEELTGSNLEVIHIVGGGTQNSLLCQLTADACNRPVVAGPVEATAIGNALMQAVALGELGSVADLRTVVRRSFPLVDYEPNRDDRWDALYERFAAMVD